MGNLQSAPLRAQVHLLLVSCVVAASHRALDVTNRDEMSDVAFGGPAAFGMSFALWRPSTQRSLPIGLNTDLLVVRLHQAFQADLQW